MSNEDLIVENDRSVTIKILHQWHTYGFLLDGVPTRQRNADILADAQKCALRHCGQEEVYVVEAEQRPIELTWKHPFGEPAMLPRVTCLALVRHSEPVRDASKHYSCLAIMWFQNEFAFPIDPAVLEKIKQIPFSALAADFEY
jgi:hypothetical protein